MDVDTKHSTDSNSLCYPKTQPSLGPLLLCPTPNRNTTNIQHKHGQVTNSKANCQDANMHPLALDCHDMDQSFVIIKKRLPKKNFLKKLESIV